MFLDISNIFFKDFWPWPAICTRLSVAALANHLLPASHSRPLQSTSMHNGEGEGTSTLISIGMQGLSGAEHQPLEIPSPWQA